MPAERHPWYVAESENDPVLGEILVIWRAGIAGLASHRRADYPNIIRAARMLIQEQADRRPWGLAENLLKHILSGNNPQWIHGEQRRDAAIALFGLDDQTYGKSFSSRREEAAHRCNQATETFRRPERRGMEAVLLRTVALAITEIIESRRSPEVSTASAAPFLNAENSLPEHSVVKSTQVCTDLPPDTVKRDEMALYLNTLIEWMNRDPWPQDRRFGGPVLTPAAIESKLRVTAVGETSRDHADADELAKKSRRLVILGGPGAGKTWLAKRTVRRCAEAALQDLAAGTSMDEVELPLYITCSRLVSADGDIRQAAVSSALDQLGDLGGPRSSTSLRLLFTERNALTLLVIDSLDEAPNSDDRLRQADTLPWRIILTSRPNSWNHQLDIKADNAHQVELEPLRYPDDVEHFIRRWFTWRPDAGEALVTQIAKRSGLQEAATVPLLLAFYCIIGGDQPLPEFRHDLYAKVLRRMLTGRWRGTVPHTDVASCLHILRSWAWAGTVSNASSGMGEWMDYIWCEQAWVSDADNDALDHIATPMGPPDIDTGRTQRRFVHRSIREHLVAEHIAGLDAVQASEELLQHIWYDPDWEYAGPAVLAMHPQRDNVLRELLCRASRSDEIPQNPSEIDATGELLEFVARVAHESCEADWAPATTAIINQIMIDFEPMSLGYRYRGTTAEWATRQAREELLESLSQISDIATAIELAESFIRLDPGAEDRRRARQVLLKLFPAKVDLLDFWGLLESLARLDLTAEQQQWARDVLLQVLEAMTDLELAEGLAMTLPLFDPSIEDRWRACQTLLALYNKDPSPGTEMTQSVFPQLAVTEEERRHVRIALLDILARQTKDWAAASGLAESIVRLATTEEDRRQIRDALIGMLTRKPNSQMACGVANVVADLAMTEEDRRQIRDALLGLLTQNSDSWTAKVLALTVAQLDPTDYDRQRTTEILMTALIRETDGQSAVELAGALVRLDITAEDQRQARGALLGLLGQGVANWAGHVLARQAAELAVTEIERRQTREALLDILVQQSGELAAPIANAVCMLNPSDGERRDIQQLLLNLLSRPGDGEVKEKMVETLVTIAAAEEDRRQVREVLLDLLDYKVANGLAGRIARSVIKLGLSEEQRRHVQARLLTLMATQHASWPSRWLANAVVELAVTDKSRRQACEALLRLLSRHASSDTAEPIAQAIAKLDPTEKERQQGRETLLRLIAQGGDGLDTRRFQAALVFFAPTVHDLKNWPTWASIPSRSLLAVARRNSVISDWISALPTLPNPR